MIKKPVHNLNNKNVGDVSLDQNIFGIKVFPEYYSSIH